MCAFNALFQAFVSMDEVYRECREYLLSETNEKRIQYLLFRPGPCKDGDMTTRAAATQVDLYTFIALAEPAAKDSSNVNTMSITLDFAKLIVLAREYPHPRLNHVMDMRQFYSMFEIHLFNTESLHRGFGTRYKPGKAHMREPSVLLSQMCTAFPNLLGKYFGFRSLRQGACSQCNMPKVHIEAGGQLIYGLDLLANPQQKNKKTTIVGLSGTRTQDGENITPPAFNVLDLMASYCKEITHLRCEKVNCKGNVITQQKVQFVGSFLVIHLPVDITGIEFQERPGPEGKHEQKRYDISMKRKLSAIQDELSRSRTFVEVPMHTFAFPAGSDIENITSLQAICAIDAAENHVICNVVIRSHMNNKANRNYQNRN